MVVPRAGTWIETLISEAGEILLLGSFPVRERGLKPKTEAGIRDVIRSFPVRERGLKRKNVKSDKELVLVVPRAGTWIETLISALVAHP